MINYQLPEDVQPMFDWLRELYPWSALMGTLMDLSDQLYGYCEWAKAFNEQREELAILQLCGAIQSLYRTEYANVIAATV